MEEIGAPGFLQEEGLRLALWGEKNGVSTCDAAIFFARKHPDHPFLPVSTDPAHSLADRFFRPLRLKIFPFVR